jgi:hypothetical protein
MRSSGAPPHTPGDRLGFVMDVPCDIGLGAQALSRSGWIELGGCLGARIRHATTAREVRTCRSGAARRVREAAFGVNVRSALAGLHEWGTLCRAPVIAVCLVLAQASLRARADRSATSSGMTSPLPIHLGVCRHRARSSPSDLASSPVIRCSLYPSRPERTSREPCAWPGEQTTEQEDDDG